MTITASTNWRAIGDTTLAVYQSEFARKNSPLLPFAADIFSAVQGYSALYLAHLGHESEYATTGIAKTNPAWHNAVGTKVRGGNNQYQQFASWADGAKEWKNRVLDPAYAYAPTTSIASYVHVYAPSSDGNDEQTYVNVIVDYANRFAVLFTTPDTGGIPVSTAPKGYQIVTFPGFLHALYLPDDITVTNAPIADSMIGWVRSGVKRSKITKTTWHDTGDKDSTPQRESGYLHGGPRDQYGNQYQVGYNGAFGAKEVTFLTPFNEDTWAAGTPDGNHLSAHLEQCFGDNINWDDTIYTGAALHAAIIVAEGLTIDDLVQHNVWYGKDCPGQIRHQGLWPDTVAKVNAAIVKLKAALAGQPVPANPNAAWPYPTPEKPWFWDDLFTKHLPYAKKGTEVWVRSSTLYQVKAGGTKRLQRAINGSNGVVGPVLTGQFRGSAAGVNGAGDAFTVTDMFTRVDLDDVTVVEEDTTSAA